MSDDERGVTTSYGVSITLERDSKHIRGGRDKTYWSPAPTSEQEAIESVYDVFDGEIEEVRGVETQEVPAPAMWSSDDPRIRSLHSDDEMTRDLAAHGDQNDPTGTTE